MTVDVYGTWIPNGSRAAVNRLDASPAANNDQAFAKAKAAESNPQIDSQIPHPFAPQAPRA